MIEIISLVLRSLGTTLTSFLHKSIDTTSIIFQYLNKNADMKAKKTKEKEIKKNNNQIEDICDKGSLEDLFDKFIKSSAVIMAFILAGCTTNIEIQTTKSWEGHYMNEKEFHKATNDIKLDRNESIWVLSNRSLKRVLIQKEER